MWNCPTPTKVLWKVLLLPKLWVCTQSQLIHSEAWPEACIVSVCVLTALIVCGSISWRSPVRCIFLSWCPHTTHPCLRDDNSEALKSWKFTVSTFTASTQKDKRITKEKYAHLSRTRSLRENSQKNMKHISSDKVSRALMEWESSANHLNRVKQFQTWYGVFEIVYWTLPKTFNSFERWTSVLKIEYQTPKLVWQWLLTLYLTLTFNVVYKVNFVKVFVKWLCIFLFFAVLQSELTLKQVETPLYHSV